MDNNLLSDNIVWLMKRVHLATRRAFDEAYSEHDLTGPQAEIMRQVCLQNGIEQRTLQERLQVTSATLTGIIDGLVEHELVERRLSHEDARVKKLIATEKGKALSDKLLSVMTQIEARLLEGFSPAERNLLRDWLLRMTNNLCSRNNESCE